MAEAVIIMDNFIIITLLINKPDVYIQDTFHIINIRLVKQECLVNVKRKEFLRNFYRQSLTSEPEVKVRMSFLAHKLPTAAPWDLHCRCYEPPTTAQPVALENQLEFYSFMKRKTYEKHFTKYE
ncbi:hypothetical protein CBL_09663 [Carabus blaptoides fortunei]